ncbi:MAG TPA: AsmA-like C-terminal region-containing protein, partial [Hyphomonadaceae bacterium]|nr:AsmA-like C-terminal region-containing protein [Hyphomonadaceae bacterium]
GSTVQALMSSLGGAGKFGFDNGAISGVNLTELGNAAKTALSSKTISLAAFGKDQKTTFNNLGASFAMKDGVAAMADLKMDSGAFIVSGGGSLDVGKQKLSLSLFPEFKDKKQGLNGYGLPVKLSGGWNGVQLNLDWDWLAKKAVGDVKTKVTNEIQDELQKNLGNKLGDLLGKGGKAPAATPAPAPAEQAAPATPAPEAAKPAETPAQKPKTVEEKAKDEAKKALGKLFGN